MFPSPAGPRRRGLLAASMLFALSLLAGCRPGNRVDVHFDGYSIQTGRPVVKSGDVVFNLNNTAGQVLHQLLIVQTDTPAAQLPLGAGAQVDESGLVIAGKVDKIDLGQSSSLTVHLAPGHYVLLCNIVGHYQLGMHTDLIVTP